MTRPTQPGRVVPRLVTGALGYHPDIERGDAPEPTNLAPEARWEVPYVAPTIPATYYPANGTATSPSPGYVHYWRAGLGPPSTPTPGYAGAWHFPSFGHGTSLVDPMGTFDAAFGALGNTVRLTLPEATHVVVHTVDYASNGATVSVVHSVDGTIASGPAGTDLEFDVTAGQLVLDVGASAATGWDGMTLGTDEPAELQWIAAPFVNDGNPGTFDDVSEDSVDAADGVVLRVDLG
jgi:hypothetical protein